MAAQPPLNFTIQPAPVNTTAFTQFTLATLDLATMPGVAGNYTDCTVFIRATVLLFGVVTGYSTSWEKCATFQRITTGNVSLRGSVTDGNAGSAGQVGDPDLGTVTLDISTTTIRLRVTPGASSSCWWYGKLQVTAIEPA